MVEVVRVEVALVPVGTGIGIMVAGRSYSNGGAMVECEAAFVYS